MMMNVSLSSSTSEKIRFLGSDRMKRNIRWDAIVWMHCGEVEIVGDIDRLAYRVTNDRIHRQISHDNLHLRIEEAFIGRKTTWRKLPHLRKMVGALQSHSSYVKTLTYPYDEGQESAGLVPIPEITFDCDEGLWKSMNKALFTSGRVIIK